MLSELACLSSHQLYRSISLLYLTTSGLAWSEDKAYSTTRRSNRVISELKNVERQKRENFARAQSVAITDQSGISKLWRVRTPFSRFWRSTSLVG